MTKSVKKREVWGAIGRRAKLKQGSHNLYKALSGELEIAGYSCQLAGDKLVYRYLVTNPQERFYSGYWVDVDNVIII